MKKIRQNVFETNSSSTHSISIIPIGWDQSNFPDFKEQESPYIPIRFETATEEWYDIKTIVVETANYYNRSFDGYFLIKGDLQKIHFLISCMSAEVSGPFHFHISLKPNQLLHYNAMVRAIEDYVKKKYGTQYWDIKVTETDHNGYIVNELIGWGYEKSEYTEDEVYEIVKKILSDDNIVFTSHSDETGPYPEEIGLINLKERGEDNSKRFMKLLK